ncbi:MAG: sulfite exporter TauE/SafE family protein [Bacteroidetes bacterium]|nr:sulfite exporter TauE/SafE family protein [Bacteroidota bacterium]
MSTTTILILLIIGLVAGLFSGMIGIGGGIIIVPCLVYFLGLNQQMAQGTSLAMMLLPVGILGVMNYYNKGAIDIKYALLLALPFAVGAFFGSKFILNIEEGTVKKIFAGVMMVVAVKMMFFDK